jgi:hypothetical protein
MAQHVVDTSIHNDDHGYAAGYFAHCTCGWSGVLRDLNRRGQALIDAYQHQTDTRGSAA